MRYADLTALHSAYFIRQALPSALPEAIDAVYVRYMVESVLASSADHAAPLDVGACEILVRMLAERFSYIRHTYLLYTKNTALPTNQFCLTLASELKKITGKNCFQLLMPSIISTESTLTGTDLNDDDVAVTDFILSDKQNYFIEVAEVLGIAENDDKLRHTQRLGDDNNEAYLNSYELSQLLAHSQEAADYYQAIRARHDFIHNGTTLGSLFQQLVEGMEQGDVAHQGQELDAGSSASEAIYRFAEVYRTLSNEQRDWLNGLRAGGETFKHYWDILTIKQEEEITKILADKTLTKEQRTERLQNVHLSIATCMQTNSGKMSAILHAHKDALFGLVIKDDAIQQAGIAMYDEAVANARHWFKTRMQHLRTGKDTLAPVLTDESRQQCASKLECWIRQQALGGNAGLLRALKPLTEQDKVVQVVAGGRHTLFLTAAGEVYACGYNGSGQLGLVGDLINLHRPTLVSADFLNSYPTLRETLVSVTPSPASGSAGLFAAPATVRHEAELSARSRKRQKT